MPAYLFIHDLSVPIFCFTIEAALQNVLAWMYVWCMLVDKDTAAADADAGAASNARKSMYYLPVRDKFVMYTSIAWEKAW